MSFVLLQIVHVHCIKPSVYIFLLNLRLTLMLCIFKKKEKCMYVCFGCVCMRINQVVALPVFAMRVSRWVSKAHQSTWFKTRKNWAINLRISFFMSFLIIVYRFSTNVVTYKQLVHCTYILEFCQPQQNFFV